MLTKRITELPINLRKGWCQVAGWLCSKLYNSLQEKDWILGIN